MLRNEVSERHALSTGKRELAYIEQAEAIWVNVINRRKPILKKVQSARDIASLNVVKNW